MSEQHFGANPKLFEYARSNRRPMTMTERKLWYLLRNRRIKGFKFRRQHPIANYIVDFFCLECKLAVEVDGGYHTNLKQSKYDKERDFALADLGIRTLRFTNTQMDQDVNKVIDEIKKNLHTNEPLTNLK